MRKGPAKTAKKQSTEMKRTGGNRPRPEPAAGPHQFRRDGLLRILIDLVGIGSCIYLWVEPRSALLIMLWVVVFWTLLAQRPRGALLRALIFPGVIAAYTINHGINDSALQSQALAFSFIVVVCGLVAFFRQRRSAKVKAHRARTDQLTGLSNLSVLEQSLPKFKQGVGVIVVAIDGFELILRLWGQDRVQRALRAFGAELSDVATKNGLVAYDESRYIIVVPSALTLSMRHTVDAIPGLLTGLEEKEINLSVSIGWSVTDVHARESEGPDKVLERAQAAATEAQARGGQRIINAAELQEGSQEHSQWQAMLSRVLSAQNVRAVYQPIRRLGDNTVIGYEALARPESLEDGASVQDLFAAAREAGVLSELDLLCRQAAIRGALHLDHSLMIFLNVSLNTLNSVQDDADAMLRLTNEMGRTPESIVIELMDAGRSNPHAIKSAVEVYRQIGFSIAIDNLDDSQEMLTLMETIVPDVIKFDRRLLARATVSPGARWAIGNAIEFSRQHRILVIAQGIETQAMTERIKSMGIEYGQGFHLGRPGPIITQPAAVPVAPPQAATA